MYSVYSGLQCAKIISDLNPKVKIIFASLSDIEVKFKGINKDALITGEKYEEIKNRFL